MKERDPGAHCAIDLTHWSRYVDGDIGAEECRKCEAHLRSCAECRAKLRDVRKTIRACREAGRVTLPADLRARARQRARALLKS